MRVKLREWRERRLMTQDDLSKRTGIAVPTISRIEQGKQMPRFDTIRKLATALDVPVDDFIVLPALNGKDDHDAD